MELQKKSVVAQAKVVTKQIVLSQLNNAIVPNKAYSAKVSPTSVTATSSVKHVNVTLQSKTSRENLTAKKDE